MEEIRVKGLKKRDINRLKKLEEKTRMKRDVLIRRAIRRYLDFKEV